MKSIRNRLKQIVAYNIMIIIAVLLWFGIDKITDRIENTSEKTKIKQDLYRYEMDYSDANTDRWYCMIQNGYEKLFSLNDLSYYLLDPKYSEKTLYKIGETLEELIKLYGSDSKCLYFQNKREYIYDNNGNINKIDYHKYSLGELKADYDKLKNQYEKSKENNFKAKEKENIAKNLKYRKE